MKSRKFKYNHSISHQNAILHMIGQSVSVFKSMPKTSDVAAWMRVSKPTARKYLKTLEIFGLVACKKEQYRPNNHIDKWSLSYNAKSNFENNEYKVDYEFYAQRVLQVTLV